MSDSPQAPRICVRSSSMESTSSFQSKSRPTSTSSAMPFARNQCARACMVTLWGCVAGVVA
eukprot:6314599-Alexandrium_andersonii.AAC.1